MKEKHLDKWRWYINVKEQAFKLPRPPVHLKQLHMHEVKLHKSLNIVGSNVGGIIWESCLVMISQSRTISGHWMCGLRGYCIHPRTRKITASALSQYWVPGFSSSLWLAPSLVNANYQPRQLCELDSKLSHYSILAVLVLVKDGWTQTYLRLLSLWIFGPTSSPLSFQQKKGKSN